MKYTDAHYSTTSTPRAYRTLEYKEELALWGLLQLSMPVGHQYTMPYNYPVEYAYEPVQQHHVRNQVYAENYEFVPYEPLKEIAQVAQQRVAEANRASIVDRLEEKAREMEHTR